MPINEKFLYGLIQFETAAWSSPFTWVDRTASIVNGITYSEGGRVTTPGQSQTDVGTLNVTFKNAATIPAVGDIVRLRRYGTSEYAFTGYVQDVSQRVVFDMTTKLTNPITLTSIICGDWVGYLSQFIAVGAGGNTYPGGAQIDDSAYYFDSRLQALNMIQDPTNATNIIQLGWTTPSTGNLFGDTDMVGSITDHLDLVGRTEPNFVWWGSHNLPTNVTTGRTGLVQTNLVSNVASSGKTFTDLVGSAGQLHYTEIDLENTTGNVANNIVIYNHSRMHVGLEDVTKIGGFNEENFVVVNDKKVIGVNRDVQQDATSATSVTTYGVRRAEIDSNVSYYQPAYNLVINPSIEYSDDGFVSSAGFTLRRRRPANDVNPFSAYTGIWSMRLRMTGSAVSKDVTYQGGESDAMPITAGTTYYLKVYAARGTVSRTDARAKVQINWIDDNETVLSSSTGSNVTLTTANTWYLVSLSATAPANAVRATLTLVYSRTGGGNLQQFDRYWNDAWMMSPTDVAYFDGDLLTDTNYVYGWTGGVGASPSYRAANNVDDLAQDFLTKYSTTSMRISRIRWNAQEDLTSVSSLTVGKTISIIYKSTTTTYRIIGIDGTVDLDRYMIDYYLVKA